MKIFKLKTFISVLLAAAVSVSLFGCGGSGQVKEISGESMINSPYINWFGRNYSDDEEKLTFFNYTAAGFEVKFEGTKLTAEFYGNQVGHGDPYISIFADGEENIVPVDSGETKEYTLAEFATGGEHVIKVLKRTEMAFTKIGVKSLKTDGKFCTPPERRTLKMEFYGDSITAGYGSVSAIGESGFKTSTESGLDTYAFYAAEALGAEANILAYSGWTLNKGGASGYSDIQIGSIYNIYSRDYVRNGAYVEWDFAKYQADIVVVNIGANDNGYLGGVTDDGKSYEAKCGEFVSKYIEFVMNLRDAYPDADIILAYGMLGETNTYSCIARVVETLKLEGDTKLHSLQLHERTLSECGADGHPHKTAHKIAANQLVDFINKNVI